MGAAFAIGWAIFRALAMSLWLKVSAPFTAPFVLFNALSWKRHEFAVKLDDLSQMDLV